jgi:hypothetical protein
MLPDCSPDKFQQPNPTKEIETNVNTCKNKWIKTETN